MSMTDLDTQKREKWHSGLSQIEGRAISGYIYPNPGSLPQCYRNLDKKHVSFLFVSPSRGQAGLFAHRSYKGEDSGDPFISSW